MGVAHQPADEEVADEEGHVEPRTSGAGASRRRAAEERHARHRRRPAGSGRLPVAYAATGRTEALAACRYPPVAHDVSPTRASPLPAAPTACHGPVGTPAGHGSGEWHPRRSRCRPGCVDAFAAAQGLRDAGLSSLIVLDVYSPIAEVPSLNQAHDVISSDAQKVQRPMKDAMSASSPFTPDVPGHLETRGHCGGCRAYEGDRLTLTELEVSGDSHFSRFWLTKLHRTLHNLARKLRSKRERRQGSSPQTAMPTAPLFPRA